MEATIVEIVAHRLSQRRKALGLTQEQVANKANVHPTYIGQVERGEKNITVRKLSEICNALDYGLDELFEKMPSSKEGKTSIPYQCFLLISDQTEDEQKDLMQILKNIVELKNGLSN